MRIWFTEIGEPLPLEEDARLLRYGTLSRSLAARGHEVVWWSSTFLHARKRFIPGGDQTAQVGGVTLRLIDGPGYRRNVSLTRIRHQQAFARAFAAQARREPPPDLIVTPVPTLEVATAAIDYGREYKVPVIVDIRDEWPDEFLLPFPAAMRPLVRLLIHPYYRMMAQVCRDAAAVIGVSQRQRDYGLRFAARPAGPLDRVIPHGYPMEPVDPAALAAARDWWAERGIAAGVFTGCFFGTLGTIFNIDLLIDAVRRLAPKMDVRLVICGDGPARARFERHAAGLPNVIFPGWVNRSQIVALMEISDVGLAPYGPSDDARMSMPNKPFEYMAGGLPILSSSEGEIRALLADAGCGVSYDPRSLDELCTQLTALHADRLRCRLMGEKGRALFAARFGDGRTTEAFETLFADVIASRT